MTATATTRGIAIHAARCAALATLLLATTAAVVAATGVDADARSWLGFEFGGVPARAGEAVQIALHNSRLAAATLAAAWAAPHLGPLRMPVDAILGTLLVTNACLVGFALGAYGYRLVDATIAHVPLEFGALSIAGGAYLAASRTRLTGRQLVTVAAVCAALLAVAAYAETYLSRPA